MSSALTATWRGRRGAMLLGPTEHRVARYLADRTSNGRVTIRTSELIEALGLERSEAYRITRHLRSLGLFGIEDDQGGTRGGRRYWRTPTIHDGAQLDPERHRAAWSRIVAWARERRARVRARLAQLRADHMSRVASDPARLTAPSPAGVTATTPAGPSFAELCRAAGLGPLMDTWGVR